MLRESPLAYSLFASELSNNEVSMHNELQLMGLRICDESGHLFYREHFMPLELTYELVFVRHGETFGNAGQSTRDGKIDIDLVNAEVRNSKHRIFQGDVDESINQLTDQGKKQAQAAADKMKTELLDKGWNPDFIFASPLGRAKDTAFPFVDQNNFYDRFEELEGIKEMSFGCWDNRRVCDLEPDKPHLPCHKFYLEQHVLVKAEQEVNAKGEPHKAENFYEVLLRAKKTLESLNERCAGKKVVIFAHSMIGAACCILMGKGQEVAEGYLAFDGPHTMPHATPFPMNFELPALELIACR